MRNRVPLENKVSFVKRVIVLIGLQTLLGQAAFGERLPTPPIQFRYCRVTFSAIISKAEMKDYFFVGDDYTVEKLLPFRPPATFSAYSAKPLDTADRDALLKTYARDPNIIARQGEVTFPVSDGSSVAYYTTRLTLVHDQTHVWYRVEMFQPGTFFGLSVLTIEKNEQIKFPGFVVRDGRYLERPTGLVEVKAALPSGAKAPEGSVSDLRVACGFGY